MTTQEEPTQEAQTAIASKLSNRAWRLNNLYWIEDENGRKTKFRMNWAQRAFFAAMWWLNVILKARQLGMSTFIMLAQLDRCLFNKNQTCGLIDKTDEDAKKKLSRMKFAYDHLDDPDDPVTAQLGAGIKEAIGLVVENKKELEFSNGSKVWAGTSLRGGTVQFLWISELGYIAFHFPDKAKEIKDGALNTVHAGNMVVIESTHEGGKYGLNYAMIQLAQEAPKEMTAMDWRFHFFPWWRDPKYVLPLNGQPLVVDREAAEYFAELQTKEGITLTPEQRHWYVKKQRTQGDAMGKEFPSTAEEALNAVVQGAIYGKIISKLRRERRICDFEHNRISPIFTSWDIGQSDFTTVWLLQLVGQDILALAFYENHSETPAHYVAKVREWEAKYGMPVTKNFVPHDANNRGPGGKTWVDYAKEAGLLNIEVVPRTPDLWVGINYLRALLPRMFLHLTNCGHDWKMDETPMPSGIAALEGYHTKTEVTAGVIKEMPVHDACSHPCDGLRTFAEAHARGMLPGTSIVAKETRRETRKVLTGIKSPYGNYVAPRNRVLR
jgi:hypothetical protein